MAATRLLLLSFLLLSGFADAAAAAASPLRRRPLMSTSGGHLAVPTIPHKPRPGIQDCEELYFEQPIDHFAFHPESSFEGMTYKERFFVCGKQWWDGPGAPIFFYTGNEANVELYLNASGLMWENAPTFGALIVFAEHRYYGKSQPFFPFTAKKMDYLSSEQALADYSRLIRAIKTDFGSPTSPVIAFGGSYGGMLASWWRLLYPHIVDGAIAGSAPVLDFEGVVDEEGIESFSYIVTRDASPEGGSSEHCAGNVRAAWSILQEMATTVEGRWALSKAFRLCETLASEEEVLTLLAGWITSAWAYMAMGNYPFPSTYILNGQGTLPAWPVRVACERLDFPTETASNATILTGLVEAVSVYYNYTRTTAGARGGGGGTDAPPLECFDLGAGVNEESQIVEDHWTYQFCTEMLMPSGSDGVRDMFLPAPWNLEEQSQGCFERFGMKPRAEWASIVYGGYKALESASNIVFSNGLLDPWSGTGVLSNVSESVVALLLREGAHHLDLMWSTPDDPEELVEVRKTELAHIAKWIEEASAARAGAGAKGEGEEVAKGGGEDTSSSSTRFLRG